MYLSQDPIELAGNNPTLYGYVKDVNKQIDILGLDLVDGQPLSDSTQVYRISSESGADAFKFNQRELDAIGKGRMNLPGVSVIRANSAEDAMQKWNKAFPDRQVDISSVRGTSAAEIREAGFDVIHNPSKKGALGDSHARLIHPDGVDGFNDSNLNELSNRFKCH
jgi:hypothetical protein